MIVLALTIGLVPRELAWVVWPVNKPLRSGGAFWYAGPGFLALAVCRRTRDEPVLTACSYVAGVAVTGGHRFCAGILEVVIAAGAETMPHVVGLASEYCRIGPTEAEEDGVPVSGLDARAFADLEAVDSIEELFAAAGLRLVGIDCEDCALMTLAESLGVAYAAVASTDPLAAVSVASSCETRAAELGARLCVPIGLSLARLVPVHRRA